MKTKSNAGQAGTTNQNTHKDNIYFDNELIFSKINEYLNEANLETSERIQQNNERIQQVLERNSAWRAVYVVFFIVLIISIIL